MAERRRKHSTRGASYGTWSIVWESRELTRCAVGHAERKMTGIQKVPTESKVPLAAVVGFVLLWMFPTVLAVHWTGRRDGVTVFVRCARKYHAYHSPTR